MITKVLPLLCTDLIFHLGLGNSCSMVSMYIFLRKTQKRVVSGVNYNASHYGCSWDHNWHSSTVVSKSPPPAAVSSAGLGGLTRWCVLLLLSGMFYRRRADFADSALPVFYILVTLLFIRYWEEDPKVSFTVQLSISPFDPVRSCFMYFGLLGMYSFCYSFLINWHFLKCPSYL